MISKPMPLVQKICREFIQNFNKHEREIRPKLLYDRTWKESEENISYIIKEVLNVLKDVWNNPAFNSEVIRILNTSEKQSVANADRKGEGNSERRPDIMFIGKYWKRIFELIYIECSHLICSLQKKINDEIKLWWESNDGMY